MNIEPVPRRSVLFLPASNARALHKATTLPCDALIIDLEDAVPPDAKAMARQAACEAARSGDMRPREVAIRINAIDTPWHDDDLAAVATAGPDAVVLPKVESAAQVQQVAAQLETLDAPAQMQLWVMLETPRGILRAAEICDASERLTVAIVGTNDLTKELGAQSVPGRLPLQAALGAAVLGARAAGRVVLDGVHNTLDDAAALEAECRQGREMGFDGKTLIHPKQIETANTAFGPSTADAHHARGLIEAFEAGRGAGVVTYRGQMVEELHVRQARQLLQQHAAIQARSGG